MTPARACFLLLGAACLLHACHSSSSQTPQLPDDPDLLLGQQTFLTHCASCHGRDLRGTSAPPLLKTEWLYGNKPYQMRKTVKYGIQGVDMPAFAALLTDDEIGAVVKYVIHAQDEPPSQQREIPETVRTADYELRLEQVVTEGLETPWAIEFVDETRALISERGGRLRWLVNDQLDPRPIQGLPVPHTGSTTGGFMDIALDPDYAQTGWVYLAYSHTEEAPTDEQALSLTKIVRGKVREYQWVDEQPLFQAPDSLYVREGNRWGCRFLFDDEGHLFFSIGDMAQAEDAQDPAKATGKIFRIWPDGSIPDDNPFLNTPHALPQVYTLGNRNSQGMALHPVTREVWFTDHGPMGGDELNVLKPGANYGWPVITYGLDYSGDTVSVLTHQAGMEQPITYWTPSPAVCTAAFVDSPRFPAWQDRLLVGSLALETLFLLQLKGDSVLSQERILNGLGRVREVKFSPEGSLYVVLNKPDVVVRVGGIP